MEEYILEECPICRGAGLLMHEGGFLSGIQFVKRRRGGL